MIYLELGFLPYAFTFNPLGAFVLLSYILAPGTQLAFLLINSPPTTHTDLGVLAIRQAQLLVARVLLNGVCLHLSGICQCPWVPVN